jgi:hypothetical protein
VSGPRSPRRRGPGAPGAGRAGLRAQLSATAASAAGPYGYTISLGGSIALAVGALGPPGLADVLLMMAGAVVAFVLLEAVAQGSLAPQASARDRPPSIWGNAHIPSAGATLCAVWAIVHHVDGVAAWGVTGFAVTSIYFVVTAVQRVVTAALRDRRPPP